MYAFAEPGGTQEKKVFLPFVSNRTGASVNTNPPAQTTRLIFIHHSTGQNWMDDDNGGLAKALRDNNYYVSDTNYGWGPKDIDETPIGDKTDTGYWYDWFLGPDRDTYCSALYNETDQTFPYSRLANNPGGPNTVIMFKSCFPNSNINGNPNDPPTSGPNPMEGHSVDDTYTVGNIKRLYNDLLGYFGSHLDKLFILIVTPPLSSGDTTPEQAANARTVANWVIDSWLSNYPYQNVAAFDFYNVLTSNTGSGDNDLGLATGNHHRVNGGVIEHITDQGTNTLAYPTGDSHPAQPGNLKATGEYLPLLNAFYHRWAG
ncbi:MAG TPA: hypothetical protein VMT46_18525 [Anaerolineaceae bacterium]|nr:hypothetical protein [Anaerolineaceae bacterium]